MTIVEWFYGKLNESKQLRYPSSSMGKVGPVLGLPMDNYHDALTDCKITIEMMEKVFEFLKEHELVDISKYQNLRISKSRVNENSY